MDKQKYMIGDIANLIGISRDTLRYYEKRGILPSQKEDNGYRYYTKEDITKLVSIIYQRKMDISLHDMEDLWAEGVSFENLSAITSKRLKEEQDAIKTHRQTIARLQLTQNDCNKIKKHLNKISVQSFPDTYIVTPHVSMENSVETWFRMSQQYSGMDMLYTFDEFQYIIDHNTSDIRYLNSQLLLYKNLLPYVEYQKDKLTSSCFSMEQCIYTLLESPSRKITHSQIQPVMQWVKNNNLSISRQIFSTYLIQGNKNDHHTYYLELYIPLLSCCN